MPKIRAAVASISQILETKYDMNQQGLDFFPEYSTVNKRPNKKYALHVNMFMMKDNKAMRFLIYPHYINIPSLH